MAEQTELAERTKTAEKPKKLWDGALKMVKGENTTQLIESFTAEMTLVAEGLCEDQSKLRREVDRMMTEEDRRIQALQSRLEAAETSLDEERAAHDQVLTEMRNRKTADTFGGSYERKRYQQKSVDAEGPACSQRI